MQTVLKFPNGVDFISHTQNIGINNQSGYMYYGLGSRDFTTFGVISNVVADNIIRARTLGLSLIIDLTGDEPTYDWPTLDKASTTNLPQTTEVEKPVLDWKPNQVADRILCFDFIGRGYIMFTLWPNGHIVFYSETGRLLSTDIEGIGNDSENAFFVRAEKHIQTNYPELWAKALEIQSQS